jgi:hypothetical protein
MRRSLLDTRLIIGIESRYGTSLVNTKSWPFTPASWQMAKGEQRGDLRIGNRAGRKRLNALYPPYRIEVRLRLRLHGVIW